MTIEKSFEYFYATGYCSHEFSDSYKEWIKTEIKKYYKGVKIKFKKESLIVTWSTDVNAYEALIFIGFAFGEQNNGK